MVFKNKVIWITGASSGIGKALAIELSKQDCKLILSSRRETELLVIKSKCSNPEQVKVLTLDLADYQNMKPIAESAITLFGKVDILINNGGISQRSPIIETSIEVDKKLMETNFKDTGVMIVGIWRQNGDIVYAPSLSEIVKEGDRLIAIGNGSSFCKALTQITK